MKKIALLLATLLIFTCVLVSCKEADSDLPENSIKKLWDVPYQYDLSKYIDIAREDYIGVSYTEVNNEVTDEDVQYEIQSLLEENAIYTDVTDRPAAKGDSVNIDFKGFIDGEAFEGGEAKGTDLVLGEGGFIPGFEEGIIGHTFGEVFTIDVTFPSDYGVAELDGKLAQFDITLNKIQSISYPTLSDSFIAEKTEYKTVEEYYTATTEKLVQQNKSSAVVTQKNEAFANIYPNVEILDLPKSEYDKYYNEFVGQYYALAEQYNQDFETFITQTAGSSVEEFKKYAEDYATSTVEMELIFFAIANNEGIIDSLTKEHYDVYLENIAAEYMTTPTEFVNMYGEESIWRSLIWDSVMDFVLANGKAVQPEAPEVEIELNTDETETPVEDEAPVEEAPVEDEAPVEENTEVTE